MPSFCILLTDKLVGDDEGEFQLCQIKIDDFIVREYDWPNIVDQVKQRVAQCEGDTWAEMSLRLSRWFAWEFEDYQPYNSDDTETKSYPGWVDPTEDTKEESGLTTNYDTAMKRPQCSNCSLEVAGHRHMQFYKLTHPRYDTDRAYALANPIQFIEELWLPGIICPACRTTWAGSRRLYIPISDPTLQQQLGGKPLPEKEWSELAQAVRSAVNTSENFELRPGDVLGTAKAELTMTHIPDFMVPFPGQLVVRDTVAEALLDAKITGFRRQRVDVQWRNRVERRENTLPLLYELIVTGTAWRIGMNHDQITACKYCGRVVFPEPESLVVDEGRWDGMDVFQVDHNPNIVLVTERVRQILTHNQFTNQVCIPVAEAPETA